MKKEGVEYALILDEHFKLFRRISVTENRPLSWLIILDNNCVWLYNGVEVIFDGEITDSP